MTSTPTTCEACGLPVPTEALAPVDVLARFPAGATTETIARPLHRRTADVRAELHDLAAAGVVERGAAEGRSHVRRWRLRPPGRPLDARQEPEPVTADVTEPDVAPDVSGPHCAPRAVSERLAALGLLAIIVLALALLLERRSG